MKYYNERFPRESSDAGKVIVGLILLALLVLIGAWYLSPITGVQVPLIGTVVDALRRSGQAGATANSRPEPPSAAPAMVAPTPSPSPAAKPVAEAPAAPYCRPGQPPTFVLGFADLKRQLGDTMGDPVECEHTNPENGDALQQTTKGLAVFRKDTGTVMFTDGWRKWALTPNGIVTWEGESNDPPSR